MNRIFLLSLLTHLLSAVELPATSVRIVDGDTIETTAGRVRLLYIDTPESRANIHGKAMAEGKAAADFLSKLLPKDTALTLWGPGVEIEKDGYGRLLAVVYIAQKQDVNLAIITAGWSPYWRKYGSAPEPEHNAYISAQESAKADRAGAWESAWDYMLNKANETTSPKK